MNCLYKFKEVYLNKNIINTIKVEYEDFKFIPKKQLEEITGLYKKEVLNYKFVYNLPQLVLNKRLEIYDNAKIFG